MSQRRLPGPVLLEELKEALVGVLSVGTWEVIEAEFARVGLDFREDLPIKPRWGKPKYVRCVLNQLNESKIEGLAQKCIEIYTEDRVLAVEDALWLLKAEGQRRISTITRRALATAFDGKRLHPIDAPQTFLSRFTSRRSGGGSRSYFYDSEHRLYVQEEDNFWLYSEEDRPGPALTTHGEMLEHCGFFGWPDQRVTKFLESLLHPEARTGEEQSLWAAMIADHLSADGFFVTQTDRISGHPVFGIRWKSSGVDGKPKNLIFASIGPKPELGFADAINNDITVLRNGEYCLVYERPIPDEGLTWEDLVHWWANREGKDPQQKPIRDALGRRLMESLKSSPAELHLFRNYILHIKERAGQLAPALIPQVYVHFDPVTIEQLRQRGERERFLSQRMDFLLLLPNRVRVILEVDGQQHYSDQGIPVPATYARTMASGRDLQLVGYEVYRFGGWELTKERAEATVVHFFEKLFQLHGIPLPKA